LTTPAQDSNGRTVVLCVAASDAHVVANHLIAYLLRSSGFDVVNLGACTPISEIVDALREHPHAEAVIIGSLNGHARRDLAELPAARSRGEITCPVILGGNLSVGAHKSDGDADALRALTVDHIVTDPATLPMLLDTLRATPTTRRPADARDR
jgi:methylaspartate mutase sigma subunit